MDISPNIPSANETRGLQNLLRGLKNGGNVPGAPINGELTIHSLKKLFKTVYRF